jgi:hypothetical protein
MKTAPILREICYTTNVISAKDIKMYDWKFPTKLGKNILSKVVADTRRQFL